MTAWDFNRFNASYGKALADQNGGVPVPAILQKVNLNGLIKELTGYQCGSIDEMLPIDFSFNGYFYTIYPETFIYPMNVTIGTTST